MKYTFGIGERVQISGRGDYFRLMSTVGAVKVEFYHQGREIAERVDVEAGFAEQFRTIQFDRVDITSATAQLVQWETALGSEISYNRGASSVSGTVGLDSATLLALEQTNIRPEAATGSFKTASGLAAATAEVVFTPASNTAGAIILSASSFAQQSAWPGHVLIAKASAPTTNTDGEVLLSPDAGLISGNFYEFMSLKAPAFLSAGLGLYFISTNAIATACYRAVRYKLL